MALVLAEVRALARLWPARSAPVAVAVLALLFMPVYERCYEFVVDDDPQGAWDRFEWAYTTALLRHTSGFLCGQLVALGLGAVLGSRSVRAVAPGAVGARSRTLSTVLAAGVVGLLLAMVNLAVATPVATVRTGLTMSAAEVRAVGLDFHPDLLRDPDFWQVLLAGLLSFPLWAAIGAGVGMLCPPLRRAMSVLSTWVLLGSVLAMVMVLWSGRFAVAAVAVSPVFGSVASAVHTGTGNAAVTSALPLVGAAYATLLAVAASIFRRRGGAGAGTGPPPG